MFYYHVWKHGRVWVMAVYHDKYGYFTMEEYRSGESFDTLDTWRKEEYPGSIQQADDNKRR